MFGRRGVSDFGLAVIILIRVVLVVCRNTLCRGFVCGSNIHVSCLPKRNSAAAVLMEATEGVAGFYKERHVNWYFTPGLARGNL